jgi:TPR repeat protein
MALSLQELATAAAHLERGDWQAAHRIVQADETSALACWAHGIVHLMEGDVPNARYWYREAQRAFPRAASIEAEIAALKGAVDRRRSYAP